MKFYYGVNPTVKREQLINSEAAKPFIESILQGAESALLEEEKAFKMSEYLLTYHTGNRSVYEAKYFKRRRNCSNLMMAYWLTKDEKYFTPLIDYIMYICDEFTWCLPAHNGYPVAQSVFPVRNAMQAVEWIDLFQAETARLFAEIVMCVGDALPSYILDRMTYEVRRRIFPTLSVSDDKGSGNSEIYWWETCKANWATVCGAGCTLAAFYFGTDAEKEAYAKRFAACLDDYLEGIGEDGGCLEGMQYWNYGFEHFAILAQILKVYSDGEIDYFANPKVKKIALFPQKIRLANTKVASFSDCTDRFSIKIGLISFLKTLYDEVLLPDITLGSIKGNIDSVCELLWLDENYQNDTLRLETNYFPDAQWYISRREGYSFAAKAGHNDEPHNHNDIGSFLITAGEEVFFSDLGSGVYVKETFLSETRYTFLHNSSRGHSVPVINGEYQQKGKQFVSRNVKATGNTFELDMEAAYPEGLVEKLHRCFLLSEGKVTLTDTFVYGADRVSVTERFVSKIKPRVLEAAIDFGVGKIIFDAQRYVPTINTDIFHSRGGDTQVYLVDFTAVSGEEKEFTFDFVV